MYFSNQVASCVTRWWLSVWAGVLADRSSDGAAAAARLRQAGVRQQSMPPCVSALAARESILAGIPSLEQLWCLAQQCPP
ncbi:hypothetical protein COO60DRAFT_586946 [Scenedesmus sp. NREL 46B-D3]|nr:hypothetical protein COO60DRAFT_586946 [Scenedesmus sp. NREL 46B-D3]